MNDYTKFDFQPGHARLQSLLLFGKREQRDLRLAAQELQRHHRVQAASGEDSHSTYADPLYLSLTTPDLHVQPTSRAVNSGNNLGSAIVGTLSYAGNPRVQGSNIDIGGYERSRTLPEFAEGRAGRPSAALVRILLEFAIAPSS